MSEPTPSTDSNALLFPAFLYGDHATCRRRWKAEGKKWGKRYQESGDFLEPKLIPVQPGSVIWTEHGAADMLMLGSHERSKNPNWHFYFLDFVTSEASPGGPGRESFHVAFDDFACRYPWGVLSLAIHQYRYLSIARVSQRLEALLSFWEQLDTVRYVDRYLKELNLSQLLTFYTYDMMLTWVEDAVGRSVREVLREIMERMRNASEDEIHTRMMRRLHHVADTDPELKHREWLKSPGIIEAALEDDKVHWSTRYDNMTTGRLSAYSGFLSELEKKYPHG